MAATKLTRMRLSVLSMALVAGAAAAPGRAQEPVRFFGAEPPTPEPTLMPGMVAFRDLDYVPLAEYADARDRLDVFMPENAMDVPVVVFFHGGALTFGSKSSGDYLARRIVGEGVGVVTANYRLTPTVAHPLHTQDAAAAVRWVIENIGRYGGDPENVFVSGHSAGAYLAALMSVDPTYLSAHGLDRSRVRGWILIAPFLYVEETAHTRDKQIWGTNPADWMAASVSPHIGPGVQPMLSIYADGDDPWRKDQNELFARELEEAGNGDVTIVEVPNRTHSSLVTALTEQDDRIGPLVVDFVRKH